MPAAPIPDKRTRQMHKSCHGIRSRQHGAKEVPSASSSSIDQLTGYIPKPCPSASRPARDRRRRTTCLLPLLPVFPPQALERAPPSSISPARKRSTPRELGRRATRQGAGELKRLT